jgi:hypothetical protein
MRLQLADELSVTLFSIAARLVMNLYMSKARLVWCAALAIALGAAPGPAAFAESALSVLDQDSDGTLDKAEVKNAAGAEFEKLNPDDDGTLDPRELGRRAGKAQFTQADPDHDGTLSKEEYLALAGKLFDEADVNQNGVLTAKELKSDAGRALLRLIH